ncbi:heparinase II/III domain-containing protein [Dyadobacter pollutisoli]|uniref:Heparinase II/III family protein n=1 Tax=Dyadobacter pollutisoli TaxID=2910158 RepID=A0A9E8SI52_9BACT|nr:heparinase II/III family protein [Dyadobacter pollutisoli]WAC09795.1 heparinase II/III family protein [Dyadobacter pollutisoli]
MLRISLFLSVIFIGSAAAQVTQRNILSKQYSPETIAQALVPRENWAPYPKTPEEWKKQVDQKDLDAIIQSGEEALAKPIPAVTASLLLDYVRSGDRERHSTASFGRRNQLMSLILAESIEGKGRFTEAIVNLVWAICEETYWGVPAHLGVQKAKNGLPDAEDPTVDLFTAETAGVLALTDYFIGEQLDKISPLIRRRIYQETTRKVFEPIKQTNRYGYLSKTSPVNNWNPWIVSNLLIADLLLEQDSKKRIDYAYNYMVFLDSYFNSLGDDGGCDEGPSYWFAAGASAYDCLEILEKATNGKVNVYKDPLIQKMAAYVYKVHIADDYFVNFADADPKLKPDGLMLYRFGKAVGDPDLVSFGEWAYEKFGSGIGNGGFHRPRKVENLLTIKKITGEPKKQFDPVKNAWLSDIEVMTARSSNGLYLATHAGHNAESHNHNDVGDFIVYADGEPIIIDAGRGNYTARTFSSKRYELWFTQSQYHNLPIINDYGQSAGRNFNAKNVKSIATDKEVSLAMDIAPSYPKEAGIISWNRLVKLSKPKNLIEISDDYALNQAPDSLKQIFMTICDVNLETPGKIIFTSAGKKTVSLTYDPKLWVVTKEFPSTEGMEYNSFKTKWDSHPVQRIVLRSKALKQKGKYVFVISKS